MAREEPVRSESASPATRVAAGARGAATVVCAQGAICAVNEAFRRLTGFADDELLGTSLPSLAHPESRASLARQIDQYFGGPPATVRENILLIGKQGQEIWMEHASSAIELAGDLFAVSIFVQREATAGGPGHVDTGSWLHSAITEDLTGRVLMTPDMAIIEANQALARMLDFEEPSPLAGRRLEDFAADPMGLQKLFAVMRAERKAGPSPVQFERRDRENLHGLLALFGSFDNAGRLESVRGQLVEANDSARLQTRLLGAQRMEAIARLAGGLAHEFNNLLTVISGHTERLLAALPSEHPLSTSACAIHAATERATSLTRQLLAFGRRQVFELRPVGLHHLIRQTQPLLARILGERITLRFDLPASVPDVNLDPRQLEYVIVNLATNAREAMMAGGTLSLAVDDVTIGERPPRERPWLRPGHYVRLIVSDTGPGMDAATRAHAFEPFFTTKHVGNGAGLGLATVFGIMKQSNGFVWVDSEVGRGSAFTLLFPVYQRDPSAASRARQAGTETILVVDRDDRVRTLVSDALQRRGYQVLGAASGVDALETFAAHPARIHLFVADAQSAGAEGLAAVEARLKAIDPMLQALVMVETPGPHAARDGVRPGTPTIQKPFTLQALADMIRAVLDSGEGRG